MFTNKYKAIMFVLLAAMFAAIGQILYKLASNKIVDIISFLFNPYIYVGVIIYAIGLFFTLKSLVYGEVSVVYPMMATSLIWVSLLSPLFFNDSMTLIKWIGIGIIILGVFFISKGAEK